MPGGEALLPALRLLTGAQFHGLLCKPDFIERRAVVLKQRQPLVELYGGCMAALKVSRRGIRPTRWRSRDSPRARPPRCARDWGPRGESFLGPDKDPPLGVLVPYEYTIGITRYGLVRGLQL